MSGVNRPGKIITTNILSELQTVLLADSTWEEIEEKHPEFAFLPAFYDAVVQTVESPTAVYQSATRPEDSFVFLNTETTNASGDPLRVPVGTGANQTGFVRTAYFSNSTSHGLLIWERT